MNRYDQPICVDHTDAGAEINFTRVAETGVHGSPHFPALARVLDQAVAARRMTARERGRVETILAADLELAELLDLVEEAETTLPSASARKVRLAARRRAAALLSGDEALVAAEISSALRSLRSLPVARRYGAPFRYGTMSSVAPRAPRRRGRARARSARRGRVAVASGANDAPSSDDGPPSPAAERGVAGVARDQGRGALSGVSDHVVHAAGTAAEEAPVGTRPRAGREEDHHD